MTGVVETVKVITPVIAGVAGVVAETPVLAAVLVGAGIVLGAVLLGAHIAGNAERS